MEEIYKVPARVCSVLEHGSLAEGSRLPAAETLKKVRNVILTGCGGERYAAEAVKPIYENKKDFKATGMFPGIEVYPMPAVDFARYYCTYRGWHPQRKDKHLVVVADRQGRSEYSAECIRRARKLGSPAIAVTSRQTSECTEAAEYRMLLDIDENEAYTFSAQVCAMTLLGLSLSEAKGFMTRGRAAKIRGQLKEYAAAFDEQVLQALDRTVKTIAERWTKKGIRLVQFTGSSQELAVAGWGSSMLMKHTGLAASLDDLEGWCHVDIFTAPNERIGCVVVIESRSPALSRAREVVQVMRSLGREVMIVTDAPFAQAEGAQVVRLPACDYEFGAPLLQHLPLAFLAAYMGNAGREEYRE